MKIEEFFEKNKRAAIAFSGGVDSSYLLYAAAKAGCTVTAYYVSSQFQPEFEFKDAVSVVECIEKLIPGDKRIELKVIKADVLADQVVCSNPPDRCYYCKKVIMGCIRRAAEEDGYRIICDGTNASDDVADRPGWKALGEFGVRSPLRECGLTKTEIRELSREAGLPVWNKPAYACLATRIMTGEVITGDKLERTENAESLLYGMGFRDFRVRMRGDKALVQVTAEQAEMVRDRENEIKKALAEYYSEVIIDSKLR
ncbi:MAG: ATP-dependent sacrificial sulfur transferase LarE [Clostridiales bacterium]|nr:ATP-dependent sacrificial sulfur transferase LarE [Clostridiales bacterium]